MANVIRRALAALTAGCVAFLLTACDLRRVDLLIPDFESSQVEGVEVWRLAEGSNTPVYAGTIRFSDVQVDPASGREFVDYVNLPADGATDAVATQAWLVHVDATNPDAVQLLLIYDMRTESGWYKVSTFNAQGSSPLSVAQTFL